MLVFMLKIEFWYKMFSKFKTRYGYLEVFILWLAQEHKKPLQGSR